jgi:hypothetical protein
MSAAHPHQAHVEELHGAYQMCARLLTSPRFNKPQREVIEEQAYEVKDQLEALGVTFAEPDERGAA